MSIGVVFWIVIGIIAVTAIISGAWTEYIKHRGKKASPENEQAIERLSQEIRHLRKRVENLEVIAASEPDDIQNPEDKERDASGTSGSRLRNHLS